MKTADSLYQKRSDAQMAIKAYNCYCELYFEHKDYEAAWKLARTASFISEFHSKNAWENIFDIPLKACLEATNKQPEKAEAFLWLGVLYGRLGQAKGVMKSLLLVRKMKESLLTSIEIDSTLDSGTAYRALGRLYYSLPGIVGGDKQLSIEYLEKAAALGSNVITNFYLAENYISLDDTSKALDYLEKVLMASPSERWEYEIAHFKEKAQASINQLKNQ